MKPVQLVFTRWSGAKRMEASSCSAGTLVTALPSTTRASFFFCFQPATTARKMPSYFCGSVLRSFIT